MYTAYALYKGEKKMIKRLKKKIILHFFLSDRGSKI